MRSFRLTPCQAFLHAAFTSSDIKLSLKNLALPMIFITVPLLGLVDTAVEIGVILVSACGRRRGGGRDCRQLSSYCCYLRMSTTGHNGAGGAKIRRRWRAHSTVDRWRWALALMLMLFRTPLSSWLYILSAGTTLSGAGRTLRGIRWLSARVTGGHHQGVLLRLAVRRSVCARPVILLVVGNILNIALDAAWLVMGLRQRTRAGRRGDLIIAGSHANRPHDGAAGFLHLRGVSLDMLKTGAGGSVRLLALSSRYHAALIAPSALFLAQSRCVRRAAGQYYRGKNAVLMTATHLYGLCAGRFSYAVEAHSSRAYGACDGVTTGRLASGVSSVRNLWPCCFPDHTTAR